MLVVGPFSLIGILALGITQAIGIGVALRKTHEPFEVLFGFP